MKNIDSLNMKIAAIKSKKYPYLMSPYQNINSQTTYKKVKETVHLVKDKTIHQLTAQKSNLKLKRIFADSMTPQD